MDADVTAIGTRRPREGRCDRCDRPLTDLVWTTWTPIALWGPEMPPVTDWREDASADDSRCMGEPFCDEDAIDWKQRARAAEADLADARQHGLLAALWVLGESREYSIRFPARPTADEAQAFTVGVINTTVQTVHDAVLALAKEATDGR